MIPNNRLFPDTHETRNVHDKPELLELENFISHENHPHYSAQKTILVLLAFGMMLNHGCQAVLSLRERDHVASGIFV
jgi:hypothetical protein